MEALAMVLTVGVTMGVGVLAGSLAVNGALRLVRHMARATHQDGASAVGRAMS
jgi:hypothetical protein